MQSRVRTYGGVRCRKNDTGPIGVFCTLQTRLYAVWVLVALGSVAMFSIAIRKHYSRQVGVSDPGLSFLVEMGDPNKRLDLHEIERRKQEMARCVAERNNGPQRHALEQQLLAQPESFKRDLLGKIMTDLGINTKPGIEIGTATGRNCFHLRSTWDGPLLSCLDPWDLKNDSPPTVKSAEFLATQARMAKLPYWGKDYRLIQGFASNEKVNFPLDSLSFLCLDARKGHKPFMEDVLDWIPRVQPGGIVAGHDFSTPGCHENSTHNGTPFHVGIGDGVREITKLIGAHLFVFDDAKTCSRGARSWVFFV